MSNPAPAPPSGRPSTFTPEVAVDLIRVITRLGCSDIAAARHCGISSSTISRWKQEHPDFTAALRMAREEFRAAKLAIIFEAAAAEGGKGWRAAAWVLERMFPEDYHPKAAERQAFREMAEAAAALEPDAEPADLTPESRPETPETPPAPPAPGAKAPVASATLPTGCDPFTSPALDFLPGTPSRNSRNTPSPAGAKRRPMDGSIAAMLSPL